MMWDAILDQKNKEGLFMYTQRIGEDSRVVMQPPELSTS